MSSNTKTEKLFLKLIVAVTAGNEPEVNHLLTTPYREGRFGRGKNLSLRADYSTRRPEPGELKRHLAPGQAEKVFRTTNETPSPFMLACLLGHFDIAKALRRLAYAVPNHMLLIHNPLDPFDLMKLKFLHFAAAIGDVDTVSFLVEEMGVDVNYTPVDETNLQLTPLQAALYLPGTLLGDVAFSAEHIAVANYLVSQGATFTPLLTNKGEVANVLTYLQDSSNPLHQQVLTELKLPQKGGSEAVALQGLGGAGEAGEEKSLEVLHAELQELEAKRSELIERRLKPELRAIAEEVKRAQIKEILGTHGAGGIRAAAN